MLISFANSSSAHKKRAKVQKKSDIYKFSGVFRSIKCNFMYFSPASTAIPFFYSVLSPFRPLLYLRPSSFSLFPSPIPFAYSLRSVPFALRSLPRFFLLFQDDRIVRSFLRSLFVRSFPPPRSPPALCIRQDWRIGRRLRSSLSPVSSPFVLCVVSPPSVGEGL